MGISILAIDPGLHSGWAIFLDGRYKTSGYFRMDSIKGAKGVEEIIVSADTMGIKVMVIEDSHPGGYTGADGQFHNASFDTYKGIGMRRGAWEQEARKRGMRIVAIKAATWHKIINVAGYRANRAWLKDMAHRMAQIIVGRTVETEDEADACCIGKYYVEYVGQGTRPPAIKSQTVKMAPKRRVTGAGEELTGYEYK